ncbi:hypothetical protein [Alcaligenes faecalis]|uniref:hypothetical protein n=1 Tax=Alcaligenes faecalis TaxID=511 RepID=UPI001C8391CF|nr:hypothetical protein [Alcaligenes faecalis]MBX6966043.1 hypothetical protein [Providencia rettgeri]MBX7031154.1 hypothetical protein [Alcaligenes faecalis]
MTFTLFGVEFNYLVMLSKFLDGFLPGIGFMMAVALAYLMALWLARKPKPKRSKLRVKLIAKEPAK